MSKKARVMDMVSYEMNILSFAIFTRVSTLSEVGKRKVTTYTALRRKL